MLLFSARWAESYLVQYIGALINRINPCTPQVLMLRAQCNFFAWSLCYMCLLV